MKITCIEIDGVIAKERKDGDYDKCEPVEGALEALWVLKEKGWIVILHTVRHIRKMEVTKNWLRRHNVEYDHIQFGKPVADIYIDSKAEKFYGWGKMVDKF